MVATRSCWSFLTAGSDTHWSRTSPVNRLEFSRSCPQRCFFATPRHATLQSARFQTRSLLHRTGPDGRYGMASVLLLSQHPSRCDVTSRHATHHHATSRHVTSRHVTDAGRRSGARQATSGLIRQSVASYLTISWGLGRKQRMSDAFSTRERAASGVRT